MFNVRNSVYSGLFFAISLLVGSSTANATNTTAFTSPATTGPFLAPCTINFGGTVGYNWFVDTYPYGVYLGVFKVGSGGLPLFVFAGNVSQFSASYGSGTWSQAVTITWPGMYAAYAYQTDYYGKQLGLQANAYFNVVGSGSGGGGG